MNHARPPCMLTVKAPLSYFGARKPTFADAGATEHGHGAHALAKSANARLRSNQEQWACKLPTYISQPLQGGITGLSARARAPAPPARSGSSRTARARAVASSG